MSVQLGIRSPLCYLFLALSILFAIGQGTAWSAEPPSKAYWLIDQYPHYGTVHLFARSATMVSFFDNDGLLAQRQVPAETITSFRMSDLGYRADNLYFSRIQSERPVLVNVETVFNDAYRVRPPSRMSDRYFFSWQQSSPEDDLLIVHAPSTTTIQLRGLQFGRPIAAVRQVNGLAVLSLAALFAIHTEGYSFELVSNHPVAAAVMGNGLSRYDRRFPQGILHGELGATRLSRDFASVAWRNPTTSFFLPQGGWLEVFDQAGQAVTAKEFPGPASYWNHIRNLGLPDPMADPVFYRSVGSKPFLQSGASPFRDGEAEEAAYLGADSRNATLHVLATSATAMLVRNRITGAEARMLAPGAQLLSRDLSELGIFGSGPFVAHVSASQAIYQQVSIRGSGAVGFHPRVALQQYDPSNTLPGRGVQVEPAPGVQLIFSEVLRSGETTMAESLEPPHPAPPGFRFSGPLRDIRSTAVYTGPVRIALPYDESSMPGVAKGRLALWRYANGWEDVTDHVDEEANIVVGTAPGLSWFALGVSPEVEWLKPARSTIRAKGKLQLRFRIRDVGGNAVMSRRVFVEMVRAADAGIEGPQSFLIPAKLSGKSGKARYKAKWRLKGVPPGRYLAQLTLEGLPVREAEPRWVTVLAEEPDEDDETEDDEDLETEDEVEDEAREHENDGGGRGSRETDLYEW